MATVHLTIDLAKITDNARRTLSICRPLGIEVVGVTKAVCSTPEVARAMIAGGIKKLEDSKLENIVRMQKAGIEEPMVLLRSPALSEAVECIARVNTILNVDLDVLRALSTEASRTGKRHSVILMVDLDRGREGFQPEDLPGVCREVSGMKGLTLQGLGAYFAFNSEREFQATSLRRLIALAKKREEEGSFSLPVISGGSTNVFRNSILDHEPPKGVNQLRIGTTILLGISSSIGPRRIQGFHHDAFVLTAELIELKKRDRLFGMLSLVHHRRTLLHVPGSHPLGGHSGSGLWHLHPDSRPAWLESDRHPGRRGASTDTLRSMYSVGRRPGSGMRCAVPSRSAIVPGSSPDRCVRSLAQAAGDAAGRKATSDRCSRSLLGRDA